MERFFSLIGAVNSEAELIDLIAHRYNWSISDILSCDFRTLEYIIPHIISENGRESLKEEWNSLLPYMYSKILKYMSFEEYYDAATGANIDRRPTKVIMDEVAQVRKEVGGDLNRPL